MQRMGKERALKVALNNISIKWWRSQNNNSIQFFIINMLTQEPNNQLERQHRNITENTWNI